MYEGKGVVVGYDGSGRARTALAWAARESARRGLPLQLVHVLPYAATTARERTFAIERPDPGTKQTLTEGIELARIFLDEDQVSGASHCGHPAGVLMEASAHAALLVVGQRSQDGPVSSAVGSTSLVLAARARCPVVVARGATGAERDVLPVVVGVTGAASPRAALDFAAHEAHGRRAPLTILAAWSLPPPSEWRLEMHGFETVAQWARDLSARATSAAHASADYVRQNYPTVTVRMQVEHLDAATALERSSRRAGLMVVGTRSPSDGGESVRGMNQVTHAVLGRAHCPVVVIPAGSASAGDIAHDESRSDGVPAPSP